MLELMCPNRETISDRHLYIAQIASCDTPSINEIRIMDSVTSAAIDSDVTLLVTDMYGHMLNSEQVMKRYVCMKAYVRFHF